MAAKKDVEHICNTQWCKGCGICVALCPQKVLALDESDKVQAAHPERCVNCQLCQFICPDLAIEVTVKGQ